MKGSPTPIDAAHRRSTPTHITASLIKLGDSDRMVSDPAQDIRGRRVHDRDGDDLGRIADLLIDHDQGRVRMLQVEHGGLLGIGATATFLPVEAITRIEDDIVYVGEPRERIAGAPPYDPDLVDANEYFEEIYRHYGYLPYTGTGFIYPTHYPYTRS